MREFKFRALKLDKSGFVFWNLLDGDPFQGEISEETIGQYTGLKDKNGQDIYEGDVVKNGHGEVARVDWAENIDTDRDWQVCNGFVITFRRNSAEDLGVIGNIYENPELLK